MTAIHFDPHFSDEERRERIYAGDIVVLGARPPAVRLVEHARSMLAAAFGGIDPRIAQHEMRVEGFAAILIPLKPAFIHHPESWKLLAELLLASGCDAQDTYLDVPRLRISTSDGYLTSGVAYAHHPHRDTWWAAPMQQINWWMPIYDFVPESAMAFHPRYWNRAVSNDSSRFNYYDWNSNQRKNAAQHVTSDSRWQPHALEELQLEPEVRLVCAPGAALAFSGAQLHSTVPNTSGRTRYSIDYRTISLTDVIAGRGAANADTAAGGTSLRDFKRLADGVRVPDEVAERFDAPGANPATFVFAPA